MSTSASFDLLASVTASTKRPADPASGKRAAAATQVASLKVYPLTPLDPEIAHRLELDTPHRLLQTFTTETDIEEGDFLVVSSVEYPIRAVEDWPWRPTAGERNLLVLEQLRNR